MADDDAIAAAIARAGASIDALIASEQLGEDAIRAQLDSVYVPLALEIARRSRSQGTTFVFGIAGAQGTGKTTLAKLLSVLLESEGLHCARLSLDDLYYTRAERARLAREVHPLLATRGVPGTHDVELGLDVLGRLRALAPGDTLQLPSFDKARDDRADAGSSPLVHGPIDVVLFEGWCLGARPESAEELAPPLNALERDDDRDARFRGYVNRELGGRYPRLFAAIDMLIFLAAPSFDAVRRFRRAQEHKLRAREQSQSGMDDAQLDRFVEHFERITRRMLETPPERAELVLHLDADQRVVDSERRA